MDSKAFVTWLVIVRGLKKKVAENRSSNCSKVEKALGDLDLHYRKDDGKELLELLQYSKADEREKLPARHGMDIKGIVYDNTATYRQAVKKYMEFKAYQQEGSLQDL
mgnify:CR=1 FL=1